MILRDGKCEIEAKSKKPAGGGTHLGSMKTGDYVGEVSLMMPGVYRSPYTVTVTSFSAELICLKKSCAPSLGPSTAKLFRENAMELNIAAGGASAVAAPSLSWIGPSMLASG